MTMDPNDFLMGQGGRTASFPNIGDSVVGWIVATALKQQTAFQTNKPMFWEDGQPRMELIITLHTELQADDEDDGLRRVYVRGEMLKSVRNAVSKAGARGLQKDGKLGIKYVRDGEKKAGMNPPKLYTAKYEPPSTPVPAGPNEAPPPIEDEPF